MEYENHHKVTLEHLQLPPRFYASLNAAYKRNNLSPNKPTILNQIDKLKI
jgi:hypothetical protein